MSQKETITRKIERLRGQVEWFYGEDFALDEATVKYGQVVKLAKEIEGDLEVMKNEVIMINQDFTS